MQKIKNIFNYINSINRVALLIFVVLVVGIFIALASVEDEPETTTSGSDVIISEEVSNDTEETNNTEPVLRDENEDSEGVPSELATTGPVSSALAAIALGGLGYFYYKSRRDLSTRNIN